MTDTLESDKQKRDFFRIKYPKEVQPALIIGNKEYVIIDLSEKGIRFRLSPEQSLIIDNEIKGKLYISEVKSIIVRGTLSFNSGHKVTYIINEDYLQKSLSEQIYYSISPLKLELCDLIFDDIEISEGKIIIDDKNFSLIKSIERIKAKVLFSNNELIDVEGKFIRIDNNQSVLLLSLNIPYQKILSEQLKIINKYAGYQE